MNTFQSIILGIIQGLTEFLPISSSAHLTIANQLFGLNDPNNPHKLTAFIATIQLGTLLAVLIYFYKDILNILSAFLKENFTSAKKKFNEQTLNSKLGTYIIAGTIPIVILGLTFKKLIEGQFTKDLNVIAIMLIFFAILLFIAERIGKFKKEISNLTIWDSIIIGIAQSIALIPGASRSGTTITAGLFLGLNRETAARFSFLLSIPAVFASGMLEFLQNIKFLEPNEVINYLISTFFAFISGYISIAFLLNFLKTKTTLVFIIYRILLGISILLILHFI